MTTAKKKILHVLVEPELDKRISLALIAHREVNRVQLNRSQAVRWILERGLDVILGLDVADK